MRQWVLEVSDAGVPSIKNEIVTAPTVPVPVPTPPGLLGLRGMNLPGGDTPWTSWGAFGPVKGQSYQFVTNADVDKLMATGANCFRLLFTWEALQSAAYGDINAQVGNYRTYADTFFALVDYITSKGAKVLLDIHGGRDAGFAAYHDVKVGSLYNGNDVGDLLENVWWQLATKYRANQNVMYGITNEPHDILASVWYSAAQKVVSGIRNAGATSRIYTPGVDWTGPSTWMNNNAAGFNLKDPLNNLGIQLHLYFDANAGGGAADVVSPTIGSERCKAVTAWARSKGIRLFLGEVGLSATNPSGKAAWDDLYAFLLANRDVWDGFTFWAAGPPSWWQGYQFYCGPGSAQLAMIQGALK